MNKEGVVIAFDFGLKRIGCAVGQKLTGTASPIGTIKNNKKDTDWNKINLWLDEWQPQAIIVGVTQQADGSASPIENEIKKFIINLREKKIPIHIIDEENSSIKAKRIIKG
jgi:RNAse H-fold protein YqgF